MDKRVRLGLKFYLVLKVEFRSSRKYVFLCISDIVCIIFENFALKYVNLVSYLTQKCELMSFSDKKSSHRPGLNLDPV